MTKIYAHTNIIILIEVNKHIALFLQLCLFCMVPIENIIIMYIYEINGLALFIK